MIRQLRQRHHSILVGISTLLPIAFAAGLAARNPVPPQTTMSGKASNSLRILSERPDLWRADIQTRVLVDVAALDKLAVSLTPKSMLMKADILVYWVNGGKESIATLPDQAVLLGALVPETPLPLPDLGTGENGVLLLYSLADQEIVAVSKNFNPRK